MTLRSQKTEIWLIPFPIAAWVILTQSLLPIWLCHLCSLWHVPDAILGLGLGHTLTLRRFWLHLVLYSLLLLVVPEHLVFIRVTNSSHICLFLLRSMTITSDHITNKKCIVGRFLKYTILKILKCIFIGDFETYFCRRFWNILLQKILKCTFWTKLKTYCHGGFWNVLL
jgi:hypothetical protein